MADNNNEVIAPPPPDVAPSQNAANITNVQGNAVIQGPMVGGSTPSSDSPPPDKLSKWEHILACAMLILFILLPIMLIIWHWPKDNDKVGNGDILILVAAAGFLGNMIHITNSLAVYIGTRKFRRSWALWYFVTPFTASALALILYFLFSSS